MHVLLVTRRMPASTEALAARDFEARLTPSDVAISDLVARAEGADAVLCCPGDVLDAKTIADLPASVKVIGTFSVGYDHIDLIAAAARGIRICNTPDVLSVATAECAMLLLRRRRGGQAKASGWSWSGKWARAGADLVCSAHRFRAAGWILGMGRIGRELARMAQGFGMEIHYRDMARLPPDLEQGAIFHDSDDSFGRWPSSWSSCTAPGGEAHGTGSKNDRIAKLPPGVVMVNAARGTLVDDAALIGALRRGPIAAAGSGRYMAFEPRLDPGIWPWRRRPRRIWAAPRRRPATPPGASCCRA